jgi:3-oxoacyl-[acyl-carrier protein] reductase
VSHQGCPIDFSGKTVLVIGGSSGIGNGIARGFLDAGAQVHVWGTKATRGDYVGGDGNLDGLQYQKVDVSDTAAVDALEPPFESLDVLVQSQGTILYSRGEFEMAGFGRVLDVNLLSLMRCAMKFHSRLARTRGSMIVISSSAAFHATKGNPAYNASKAGAAALTRTLAQAWAADGIRVNGIAPGFVDTKLTAVTTKNERRRNDALARIPIGRFGTVEEMAGIALFLASPMSGFMVGQTLLADGGMLL